MGQYRYFTLQGKASIEELSDEYTKVTILEGNIVNPKGNELYFVKGLDSLKIGPEPDQIQITLAFEEETFDDHLSRGFEFKDAASGAPISTFSSLVKAKMDPVKPKPGTP